MAEMTKEKWTSVGLKIAEHLEEVAEIAKRNDIHVSLVAFEDGVASATYIDGDDYESDQYGIRIRGDGTTEFDVNQCVYYTKA